MNSFFSFILRTWGFPSCLVFFPLCEYSCYEAKPLFSQKFSTLRFSNGFSRGIPKKPRLLPEVHGELFYCIKIAACIKKPTQYSKGYLPFKV